MSPDDGALLNRFERHAIPRAEWTHAMHLRIGWCAIERDGLDAAVAFMRDGVRALNVANGVANTPDAGYHETITIAWLRLIDHARREAPAPTSALFLERHPELTRRDALQSHYSRERLMGREARREWVEPDVRALP
ncbi:MAG: hypothetical protein ACF8QF_10005 [Phycisphaerales bacterium]